MMQPVQSLMIGYFILLMSRSVAFHYVILEGSCLLPHEYVPPVTLRATVINALLRTSCHIGCPGEGGLK